MWLLSCPMLCTGKKLLKIYVKLHILYSSITYPYNKTRDFFMSCQHQSHSTIGISPTAPPDCVDALPNCDQYGSDACINFKPWARDNCRKYCDLCGMYSSFYP